MKVGNMAQIEQASVLGGDWRLLCFLGDWDEGVATIIVVGGKTRADTRGVQERNTIYQQIGVRSHVRRNIRLKIVEIGIEVEFAEGL
jgi:hypothetical protein